jgi:hypothetical protein
MMSEIGDLDDSDDASLIDSLVRTLLISTRSNIEEGNRDAALSSILQAICLTRGEGAIFQVLDEAKRKIDVNFKHEEHNASLEAAHKALEDMLSSKSFLSERGEEDILQDAFEDGSSVICSTCGALIPAQRAEAHSKFWCPANEDNNDISEDEC